MVYKFEALQDDYAKKYAEMVLNDNRIAPTKSAANKIIAGKDRYLTIQNQTNIPWYFIGLLHLRESDCNFHTHLHNGDPLTGRTYHVPAGRPPTGNPPFSFEFSALDALRMKGYDKITNWSIPRIAYCLEMYNGFGYRMHGVPSAYLWSGTNIYRGGKYVADGVFSSTTYDVQLGTMGVLKEILELTKDSIDHKVVDNIVTPVMVSPKAEIPVPTNKELATVSRKFWWSDWTQYIAGASAIIISIISMLRHDAPIVTPAVKASLFDFLKIETIQPYLDLIVQYSTDHSVFGLLMGLIGLVLKEGLMKKYIKEDVAEGRAIPSDSPQNPVVKDDPLQEIVGILPTILSLFGLRRM